MNKFILKSIFLFFIMLPQLEAFQSPLLKENITFYTENYPPANYLVNDKLKGISVDTLKAIWKHLNISEQEIQIVPWSRGYRFTLDENNTALFTMSKTQPRESLFKWVGPIFNSTHVLMAKKSKNFHFSTLGKVFYHNVATVEGDIAEISLHEVGFPSSNMATVSQIKQAFLMMQSDRVDMIAISIHGFSYLAKQLGFDEDDYEQVWHVNKIGNYFAFNINTADEVINTYQKAFDDIAKQRLRIKESYELPLAEY
ncbi:MAG: transporter substrate-binding domain-containing protein [Colwellia sp.]|nr:transporter substrate-binding domain-containing protein [Colwellia sp.]